MATWLADVEALTARAAWPEARASLERDLDAVGATAELCALYGECLLRLGQPADALAWLEPRLHGFGGSANRRAFVRIVNLSGAAAFELGRIDEAAFFFELARERAVAMGDHLTGARALNNLALVASTRGQWSTALQYYQQAIPSYERVGSVRGVAESYHNIAATLIESGDLSEAEEWHRRAMELARDNGNDRLRAFILAGRAEVRLRQRDVEMARVLGTQAARVFDTLEDRSSQAHALGVVGQAELSAPGDEGAAARRALETLTTAVALARQSGVVRVLADCLVAHARAARVTGDRTTAKTDLTEALSGFQSLGAGDRVTLVNGLLAELAADESRGRREW
jgi:tetratricopeptide (TPR) repeat protein